MFVHFVTDDPTKIPAIRAMLEPQHRVETQLLGEGDTKMDESGVLMVDADLRQMDRVEQLRGVLQELSSDWELPRLSMKSAKPKFPCPFSTSPTALTPAKKRSCDAIR